MPFSLDQPAAPVPVSSPRPLATARPAATRGGPAQELAVRPDDPSPAAVTDAFPDGRPSPRDTASDPGASAGADGPRPTAGAATADRPARGGNTANGPADADAADGSAGGTTNEGASDPANGGAGVATGGGPVHGGAGVATGGGPVHGGAVRMPAESPWAQPPQRPAAAAVEPGQGSGTAGAAPAPPGAGPRQEPTGQDAPVGPTTVPGAAPAAPEQQGVGVDPAMPQRGHEHDPAASQQDEPDPAASQQAAPSGPYPPQQAGPFPPRQGAPYPTQQAGPHPPRQGGPYPSQQGSAAPPGPYPPGWHPPPWQQAAPVPQQAYQVAEGVTAVPPAHPDPNWHPAITEPPTAEDFARRRQVRPADPVATMGVRAVANRMGLRLPPGRHEQEVRRDIETVRRNFGGLRQVTVVNPKGGAGKTVAILLLAMTFGQKRGGYVLAWDNNETQGTLGMRAQQDFHSRTVRDMLRDLGQFQGAHGRVGDLSQYVRSQGEGMFDVLASDESATGGEMLTAAAFAEIREVVSRFYKLIFVDTGNNVRAQNWQAAMDATDQLVVTMSARNDSAETAARMLDHLEQSGRQRLVRQAVTVVSMPPSRKEIDLPAIQEHFAARTRAVLLAPYERLIDTGEPIRYGGLSGATRDAWLKIAAAVAEGL
ncbi:chromosome partitioning protein [Micromonospora sp. CPCC 205546]|uniref:MinD/ParA family ATP-binding protein n=1 Tax=Micromonospora sp. CPCC 205546 TaxID=3122397 RepID=UPI003FA5F21D